MDLSELIERLEKATGPDVGIDGTIYNYLAYTGENAKRMPYTASLDAAMTLVPESYKVALEVASYQTGAWVGREGHPVSSCYGSVRPAAIALCIAALKARSKGQGGER